METIIKRIETLAKIHDKPNPQVIKEKEIKLGLRHPDGTGVIVGFTSKGEVIGYKRHFLEDGTPKRIPIPGKLFYCGYDVEKIIKNYDEEKRFGFEEIIYLLLSGELPKVEDLEKLSKELATLRILSDKEKMIIIDYCAHDDHMCSLHTSISSLHTFDKNPNSTDLIDVIKQCISIIAKMSVIIAYNYRAKKGMGLIASKTDLSTAENFLYLINEKILSKEEALILDSIMVLLAEHGGGNNSTFSTRCVTSSGANTYMAISTGIASLSGYRHGGAAEAVGLMMTKIKEEIREDDYKNEEKITKYLSNIIDNKELIYGMGHAVYTISDPRFTILESFAKYLAEKNSRQNEFGLYQTISVVAPRLMKEKKGVQACMNVDFYVGFIYDMLGIPQELYTPIFAMSRVAGWSAHRIEELVQGKIIRPAYVTANKEEKTFIPISKRI